jgi:hypothetical protein
MLKRQSVTLLSVFILIQTVANAATCSHFIGQIYYDVTRHAQAIHNQHLPWMKLSYLQHKLGRARRSQISEAPLQYQWICPENENINLTVTEVNGQIIKVDGEYSDENGGELFTADLPVRSSTPHAKPLNPPFVSQPEPLNHPVISRPVSSNDVCEKTMVQLAADTKSYLSSFAARRNKHKSPVYYPWMSLTWLNRHLGQPQMQSVTENLYQWDHYIVYTEDRLKQSAGTRPPGVTAHSSLNDIRHLLGAPKTSMSKTLNKYTWNCPSQSFLTLVSTQQGKIVDIEGDYCKSNTECRMIAFPGLGVSELNVKFNQLMQAQAKASAKVSQRHINTR